MTKKVGMTGIVLAGCLCSTAVLFETHQFITNALAAERTVSNKTTAKVKTPAQAIKIARQHYINGRRGIRYSGKPESILNWRNPKVTRARSRQNNPLWRVHFKVPSGAALPTDDFIIVIAENGLVNSIIQAGD